MKQLMVIAIVLLTTTPLFAAESRGVILSPSPTRVYERSPSTVIPKKNIKIRPSQDIMSQMSLNLTMPQVSIDLTAKFVHAIKSLPPEKIQYITRNLSRIASNYEDVAAYVEIYLHLPQEVCSGIVSGGGSADGGLLDLSRCEFLSDQSSDEFDKIIMANIRFINVKYRFEVIEKSLENVSSESPYLPEFIDWCDQNIDFSASMKEFNDKILSACQMIVEGQSKSKCLTGDTAGLPSIFRGLAAGLKSIVSECTGE